MRVHRPTRSVSRRAPANRADRPLSTEMSTDERVPTTSGACGEPSVPAHQPRGDDSSTAATTTRAGVSRRLANAPPSVHAGATPAVAPSAAAAARRSARRVQPAGDPVHIAKRQLERVQLALSARQRSQESRPSLCTTLGEPVFVGPSAVGTLDEQAISAAETALQKESEQIESETRTACLAEQPLTLQREGGLPRAEREQPQQEISQLVIPDGRHTSAAAAQVEAIRCEHEARIATAMSELQNATLTIRELEERVVASELLVGRTEASGQKLHQRLAYEQEGRANLEAELARLQTQLANNHIALDEANNSEAAVAARLTALQAESKRSQSEGDQAFAAATAELVRAREQAEKRVAAAQREAEEASREAKDELQRRVREIQSLADLRVAAARRQGDYYRLEAETLNLTMGFRSPNGTALHRHGHLPAPEETFGESFSKTPLRASLPHFELRLPHSGVDRESTDATVRELQASKAKLEEDLEQLQRQLAHEREHTAAVGRTNASPSHNMQATTLEPPSSASLDETHVNSPHVVGTAVEVQATATGCLETASVKTALEQRSGASPTAVMVNSLENEDPTSVLLQDISSDGEETEEDEPFELDQPAAVLSDRVHLETRRGPEQHDQLAVPNDSQSDMGATSLESYDVDSLDEVITTPASQHDVIEYARSIGLDPDHPDDVELMWIAKEGLDKPLPDAWKPCQSPDGKRYYFNFDTEESVWEHPEMERHKRLFLELKRKMSERKQAQANRLAAGIQFADHAAGTPAPRTRPEDTAVTPQRSKQWAQSANQATTAADAAARGDLMLRAATTTLLNGIVALKYNRGVGGANRRLLWLSDDSTTLKWVDEKRLAKLNRKSDKGGTPKRDREATKLPLQSVVDVEYGYGRDASPNFKKHGFPADPWVCFTIFTKDRTFDFSASSSSHARAAVVAISHASGDPGGQLKRAVGSMLWMAARWHLHDRWSQRGGIVEPKKVLSDVLFECAAEKESRRRSTEDGIEELRGDSGLLLQSIASSMTRTSPAHRTEALFSPGVKV